MPQPYLREAQRAYRLLARIERTRPGGHAQFEPWNIDPVAINALVPREGNFLGSAQLMLADTEISRQSRAIHFLQLARTALPNKLLQVAGITPQEPGKRRKASAPLAGELEQALARV